MFAENLAALLHFRGSPLAAAAALAAVQTTLDEKLPERAATLEADLLGGLRRVQQRFPEVLADVRGRGLLAGVEFTDPDLAKLVITAMGHHGVLVATA